MFCWYWSDIWLSCWSKSKFWRKNNTLYEDLLAILLKIVNTITHNLDHYECKKISWVSNRKCLKSLWWFHWSAQYLNTPRNKTLIEWTGQDASTQQRLTLKSLHRAEKDLNRRWWIHKCLQSGLTRMARHCFSSRIQNAGSLLCYILRMFAFLN